MKKIFLFILVSLSLSASSQITGVTGTKPRVRVIPIGVSLDTLIGTDGNGYLFKIHKNDLGISGSGSPGGSNTQLQYNNAGAFGGSTITYNNSTNVYTLSSGSLYPFILRDNTAIGVGGHIYGSSVLFSANRSVGGETTTAYITGALNDTTNAAYKSYLAFATTQVSDGTAERMRLTHDGNLLVGTTSNNGYKLDVIGPTKLTGAITHNATNASNAAYAVTTADYYIFLPDITANRVITLPSAASSTGRTMKIWNKNSTAFTWSFSTAVKDAASADVTNLNNDAWYDISSDGTNWNLVTRNKSVFLTASTASLTVNVDDFETAVITALAANLTINAPTGTPVNGQTTILFRIEDNGTSRTLTFNSVFRAIGVTLPAATTAGKTMYIGAIWNGTDSKYDVVSVNEEL